MEPSHCTGRPWRLGLIQVYGWSRLGSGLVYGRLRPGLRYVNPGAPSIYIVPTLGPKAYKCDLLWALWRGRRSLLVLELTWDGQHANVEAGRLSIPEGPAIDSTLVGLHPKNHMSPVFRSYLGYWNTLGIESETSISCHRTSLKRF